jgi:homoserine O-acetyltransferase
MEKHVYKTDEPFKLEKGGILRSLTITYHTLGTLNAAGDNVVWICHAFTANSDVSDWWDGMVGEGKIFDPTSDFIVCANILGSCYGTTGPLSVNPGTNEPYFHDFPEVTVKDMVKAHELLRQHLGIKKINIVTGGSIGGFQALEWSIMNPELFVNLVLIASSAKASPWAIAFNESQRMAINADPTFKERKETAGIEGMKAARSVALLSYRNYQTYTLTQSEYDNNKTENFKATTYQQYQGEKLARRFNAFSYYQLTKALDTHNVARGRQNEKEALGRIKANTLVLGISTDILFPVEEQKFLAHYIPQAKYFEVDSKYGHDGFLLEISKLTRILRNNLKKAEKV